MPDIKKAEEPTLKGLKETASHNYKVLLASPQHHTATDAAV